MKKPRIVFLFCLLLLSGAIFAEFYDAPNEDNQVQHIYADVDIASVVKYYEKAKPRVYIKAVYPQLYANDVTLNIDQFNQQVTTLVQDEIAEFKNKITQNQLKTLRKSGQNSFYIDYNTSIIKPNDKPVISVRFSMQGYTTDLDHPFHYHRVLNYDLDNGEILQLNDLFKSDSNYLELIGNYARDSFMKKFPDKQMVMDGTEPRLDNFKNWNIRADGLLITFDEYQVASKIYGAQTLLIPYDVLKIDLADQSAIAICIIHPRKCKRGKILTGGFIDEARIKPRNGRLNPVLSKL